MMICSNGFLPKSHGRFVIDLDSHRTPWWAPWAILPRSLPLIFFNTVSVVPKHGFIEAQVMLCIVFPKIEAILLRCYLIGSDCPWISLMQWIFPSRLNVCSLLLQASFCRLPDSATPFTFRYGINNECIYSNRLQVSTCPAKVWLF